jgi:hypothetical protein
VLTLGGGIVFTPIATALTVVALRRTRPETLVDFGALLVGAAALAFYTLIGTKRRIRYSYAQSHARVFRNDA